MANLVRREALVKKIYDQGGVTFSHDPRVRLPPTVVSLEDFFEGNSQPQASIASNLTNHPGSNVFYHIFEWIRNRPTVQDVVVAIVDICDNDPDPNWWPYSDALFVLTKASVEMVSDWVSPLRPDPVEDQTKLWEKWNLDKPAFIPKLLPDYKAMIVWWD